MNGFKLPGTVWTALLIALPLLAAWLNEFFPGAIWAAPVAGLLLIAGKVIEVVGGGEPMVSLPDDVVGELPPAREPGSVWWG